MIKLNFYSLMLLSLHLILLLNTHLPAQGLPYFGQEMPGMQPVRFAPNIFTEEFHAPPIFSPDGTEVYYNLMDSEHPHILYMKLENGIWSEPAVAPFCIGDYTDSPFITSDGQKLFFLTMNQPTYEESICMVIKQDGEWGIPQILGNEVNFIDPHWQASAADNQNLYFGARSGNLPGDIYFSEYLNYNYTTAVKLGSAINTNNNLEGSPFIAPDESYMIFDKVVMDGTNDANLWISFKQSDGSWSEAVYITELNTEAHDLYANVSPNGRFLMFLSGRENGILLPYWVDAQIIYDYITDADDEINVHIPSDYTLHQNYPNPFNPSTTIKFTILKNVISTMPAGQAGGGRNLGDFPSSSTPRNDNAYVTLKIYDILGNEITTLIDEQKPAGEYEFVFDGSELTSGVYFYILKIYASGHTGDFQAVKKMILLK